MAGFNRIVMMGNLTRDPQLSYTPNQTAVVDFGLATNRRWTAADGAQRQETCFVDCRAFGRQAENINKYLTKGRLILVEGRLTFDSWTAQDGTKRSKHRVTVENFQFLPGAADAGSSQPEQPAEGAVSDPSTSLRPGAQQPPRPFDQAQGRAAGAQSAGVDSFDGAQDKDGPADDIPF
jgi:single-strand DNA-binding protein